MEAEVRDPHSFAWRIQTRVAWLVSSVLMLAGIVLLPVDLWAKGYMLMGLMFSMGSTFTLAKTVRDDLEASQLRNRIKKAKTEQFLQKYEMDEAA